MNAKKITNIGVLMALSLVMMILVKFPIIPTMPFLLYEPGDVPILIISFLYGPLPALVSTLFLSILMAVITGLGGPYGALMHFLATGAFVGVAGYIYRIKHTKKGAITGLISGSLAMTAIMIPANLIVTPIYLGASYQQVIKLLIPGIIPFNLSKSLINSTLTFLVYKKLANFLREKGLIKSPEAI
ncbi:MAG: riboflavin transporter [Halanaerobiales bacterium]|nr:riboflavin transporter [Halanaerobiales bacterium]